MIALIELFFQRVGLHLKFPEYFFIKWSGKTSHTMHKKLETSKMFVSNFVYPYG